MNSATEFTGNEGEITIKFGMRSIKATGVVSRRKSNGNFLYREALIVLFDPVNNKVYPSGAELITACVLKFPPIPVRFSTTNCWRKRWDSDSATIRATASVPPPAATPTSKRIDRSG